MSLKKLLEHFSAYENFPIKTADVKAWLIDNHHQDQINFLPIPDMDPLIMRGKMRQYTESVVPYGEPQFITDILFSIKQNLCWQRLVICKEMMHIFDSPSLASATKEQVESLTIGLTSGAMGQPDFMADPAVLADHMALYKALCVLAPLSVINTLRDAYAQKTKSDYDIALFLRIPEVWVSFLFTTQYQAIYGIFSGSGVVQFAAKEQDAAGKP